jgi:hypothetical protein
MMTDDGQKVSGVIPGDDVSKTYVRSVDPATLPGRPPFKGLFPIIPAVKARITENMRARGFDPADPIQMWRQGDCVLDGHTRQESAIEAGCRVDAIYLDFDTEDEAYVYAIDNQQNRRNITIAEVIRYVKINDRRKEKGGDRKSISARSKGENSPIDPGGRSADEMAAKLNISPDKVKAVRALLTDPEIEKEVSDGKKNIFVGAAEVRAKKRRKPEVKDARDADVAPGTVALGGQAAGDAGPTPGGVVARPARTSAVDRAEKFADSFEIVIRNRLADLSPGDRSIHATAVWKRMSKIKSEIEAEHMRVKKAKAGEEGQP